MDLTNVQHKALEYIQKTIDKRGVSPTLREIGDFMGYKAIGSVQDLIVALRKKGFLQEASQQSARCILPTVKARQYFSPILNATEFFDVPCLGKVPAGDPLAAIEDESDRIQISHTLFSKPFPKAEQLFALRANGQSMINAGILDGDWLIVESTQEAPLGSIVIARLEEEDVTCKRFMADKTRGWFLQPENERFQNIYAQENPFEIIGRVVALQRAIV